jgi:hypothetical protein
MAVSFHVVHRSTDGEEWREPLTLVSDPLGSLDDLDVGARVSHDMRFEDGEVGRYWIVRERDGDRVGLEFIA